MDLTKLKGYVAYTRKSLITAVGLATTILALGVIPNPESGWIAGFVAVGTAILNYKVRNADTPTQEHAGKHEAPDNE